MVETFALNLMLPTEVLYVILFGFGVIIGSFLNVYLYRFHTGKSLNGSSHCLSCGKPLAWYELFPLFSYVYLRGRCSACGCYIPARYFVVELLTGLLFVLAASNAADYLSFVWLVLTLILLLLITVYDYYHFIIPDEWTGALGILIGGYIGIQWYWGVLPAEQVWWTLGASLAGGGFFFFLWLVSGGRWLGFGDVKLAIPLSLWVGPTAVFSFIVLSFWIGAVVSLLIVAGQKLGRGQRGLHQSKQTLTMKSAVPFAPFMIAGAGVAYFLGTDVLTLFSFS